MLHTFLLRKGKPLETEVSRAQMLSALGEKDSLLWVDVESPTEFESECLFVLTSGHAMNERTRPANYENQGSILPGGD